MSGIKEVNQFVTVTQVRKIVVQSLAPLVARLQTELQKMSKQSLQLQRQNEKFIRIQKGQDNIQASIRQLSKSISEVKTDIVDLNNEDKKTMLYCNIQLEKIRGQLGELRRQLKKNSQNSIETNKKLEKMSKDIALQKQTVDTSLEKIRANVQMMYSDTLQLTKRNTLQFKANSERFAKMCIQIQKQQAKFQQTSNYISMYQSERQQIYKKIQEGISKLHNSVTQEQLQALAQKFQQQSTQGKQILESMPKKQQIINLKDYVAKIEDKVRDFAKILQIQIEVESIKRNLDEEKTNKIGNHVAIKQILSKIQQRIQQMKTKNLQQTEQAQKTTQQKIREIKKELKTFKQKSQQQFSESISKNQSLQNSFTQFRENIPNRQAKLKKEIIDEINEVSDKINTRCASIQQLGENLQFNLSIFGNKLVKIKSDNDILEESLRKDIKELFRNKNVVQRNFMKVGKILSKLTQTQLLIQSMNLFNSITNLKEKLVYVTYNDGIICEIEKLDNGENVLFYRKRHMNFEEANKALMTGLVDMVDDVIYNQPFLNWNNQSPSTFFIENILQNYKKTSNSKKQNTSKILPQNQSQRTQEICSQFKQTIGEFNTQQKRKSKLIRMQSNAIYQTISTGKRSKQTLKVNGQYSKNDSTKIENSGIYRTISTAKDYRDININSKQKSTISVTNRKKEKYYNIRSRKTGEPSTQGRIFASRSGRYSRLSNLV